MWRLTDLISFCNHLYKQKWPRPYMYLEISVVFEISVFQIPKCNWKWINMSVVFILSLVSALSYGIGISPKIPTIRADIRAKIKTTMWYSVFIYVINYDFHIHVIKVVSKTWCFVIIKVYCLYTINVTHML